MQLKRIFMKILKAGQACMNFQKDIKADEHTVADV